MEAATADKTVEEEEKKVEEAAAHPHLLLSLYRHNLLSRCKSIETSGANLDHLMSIWP